MVVFHQGAVRHPRELTASVLVLEHLSRWPPRPMLHRHLNLRLSRRLWLPGKY